MCNVHVYVYMHTRRSQDNRSRKIAKHFPNFFPYLKRGDDLKLWQDQGGGIRGSRTYQHTSSPP